MRQHTQGFSKGIMQDLSTNKYPSDNVYWAQNFRLVSKDGLATGALTNVAGNNKILSLGGDSEVVYEFCLIRDTLVIFVGSDEGGKIYIWEHTDTDFETESPKLIYSSSELMFTAEHPVRAVGRYENENVQKVYFTDGYSFFKHLNIVHPTLGLGGLLAYPLESLDLIPDVVFPSMELSLEQGGALKAGKIQYAYQFYSVRGSESVFSPTSQLLHLTASDEGKNSFEYIGSEVGTIINKSVNVAITNIDTLFTRLRLIALEYTVLYQQPSIRIIGEYDIEGISNINIVDNGSSIGEYTMEEFRFLQNDFYPKSLDIKDDYLFAANITNNYFDITDAEFDARAYRANAADVIEVYNGNNKKIILLNPDGSINSATLPAHTEEQFNIFNDITNDYASGSNTAKNLVAQEAECKYKPGSAGTILGGKGVNIEYEFITEEFILDDSPRENDYSSNLASGTYPRLKVGVDTPYENNANPLTNVSYQRDEIYRFAIVPIDLKGREGFAKWIGDIRFPSNRDAGFEYAYYDSINNRTIGRNLGIKFHVNLPTDVANKISGYRIVRAERTNSDKTIVCQGLVGYPIRDKRVGNAQNFSLATNPLAIDMLNKHTSYQRETQGYNGISAVNHYTEFNGNYILDPAYMEFNSPDVVFNKPKLSTSDAFIEVFGIQNEIENVAIAGERGYQPPGNAGDADKRDIITADKSRNFAVNTSAPKIKSIINTTKLFSPKTRGNASNDDYQDATKVVLEGSFIYNNQVAAPRDEGGAQTKFGLRGSHVLLGIENELPLTSSWVDGGDPLRFLVANYRVNKVRSMYNGSSYEARTYTKYYPASGFISKDFDSTITPIIPGSEGTGSALIQVLDDYDKILPESTTCYVTTNKYFNFQIYNYGNETFTMSDIVLGDEVNWEITIMPYGVLNAGEKTLCKVSYIGAETGFEVCTVTIENDSDNDTSYTFAVAVDYEGGTPDYTIGTTDLTTPIGEVSGEDSTTSTGGVKVYNGDTYIGYFAYMRGIYDIERENGKRIESYVFFPVESSINLELRLDDMQSYINWGFFRDANIPDYKLTETVSMGVSLYANNYPTDVGNLYRYNTAYSAIDKSKEYYARPFDFTQVLTEDCKITASEKKINGEYIDSWTKFKFNNNINVDSKHNAITKILTFKNNLYFVQPTAVGIASVNQRSLIQDNQPGQLSLGTGGILTRYDYITDKSGSEFYDGIIATDDFLFYVDGRRKRANKLVPGKEEAISVIKGIDSTLDKLPFDSVRVGFDRGYNEVLFSIDGVTLSFSEISDGFISSYTFNPGKMISIGGDFYTTAPFDDESPWLYADNELEKVGYSGNTDADASWDYIIIGPSGSGTGLFKHNIGNPGEFYGAGGADDSYLTLIINPQGNQVCYFDNLDLRTEATNNGVDQPDDIFYTMEASNNYQSISRELAFTSSVNQNVGTVKRIGRVWRTPIMPIVGSGLSGNRMVDTYLKVTLRYDNNSGNKFRVHDILTIYRPANH